MEDIDKFLEQVFVYFDKREAEKLKIKNLIQFTELLTKEVEHLRIENTSLRKNLTNLLNDNESSVWITQRYVTLKDTLEKCKKENLLLKTKVEEQELLHAFKIDDIKSEYTEKLQANEKELQKLKTEADEKRTAFSNKETELQRKLMDTTCKNRDLLVEIRQLKFEMKTLKEELQQKQTTENFSICYSSQSNNANIFDNKYPPLNVEINPSQQIRSTINNDNISLNKNTENNLNTNNSKNNENNEPPLFQLKENVVYGRKNTKSKKNVKKAPPLAECSNSVKNCENDAKSAPKPQRKRKLYNPDDDETLRNNFEVDE